MPRRDEASDACAVPDQHCILLVTNDPEVGGVWAYALRQKGQAVTVAASAANALAVWSDRQCDLILIDVCGPDLDGIELTRRLRAEAANPILLFTPQRDEAHVLEAYRAGVDECVVKPISPSLFLAKVNVWMRRAWTVPARVLDDLERGPLRLDAGLQQVSNGGAAPIGLTNLEFRVLYLLMSHPGQVLPTDLIVERVWGCAGEGDSVLLKNVIYRLRRKIEPDPRQPRFVQTAGRQGYRFSST